MPTAKLVNRVGQKIKYTDNELAKVQAQLDHLDKLKTDFGYWCDHYLSHQFDDQDKPLAPAAHHRLLIDELTKIAKGETRRLMVFMPPGSAKSEYVSKLFPSWYLASKRNGQIIGASHTIGLARKFSRAVRDILVQYQRDLGIALKDDNKGVESFSTSNGGEYLAAGVGTAISGRRAKIFIIDDPVANREAAESPVDRQKNHDWYLTDCLTRQGSSPMAVVLCMTRYHEDDLAGRLLDREGRIEDGGAWRVVELKAQAEDLNDPLGRAPGEFLWPESGYAQGLKEKLALYGEDRDWISLYQQRPAPAAGALFMVGKIQILDTAPVNGKVIRAWDLAATNDVGSRTADYTVGLKLLRTELNGYVVLDVVRFKGSPEQVEAELIRVANADGRSVQISLPQDPGAAGKSMVAYLTRSLAGFAVKSSPETGSKATRAAPVVSQCNVGNLSLVAAPWNSTFVTELAGFPNAAKDDQVDALSRAFNELMGVPPPNRRFYKQWMLR